MIDFDSYFSISLKFFSHRRDELETAHPYNVNVAYSSSSIVLSTCVVLVFCRIPTLGNTDR